MQTYYKSLSEGAPVRLERLFSEAGKVVVVTHVHPDGDALGSSFGLFHFLDSRAVPVDVVTLDPVPDTLAFILDERAAEHHFVASENMAGAESVLRSAGLLVCLDFPTFSRAGDGLGDILAGLRCRKVLVDHHLSPDRDAFDLVFSETGVSSASELLYWVLDAIGGVMPPETARCLMAGMTTDTNNFANSVYPSTFDMASRLLRAGVDRNRIVTDLYHNYREQRYRLMGYLLSEKMVISAQGVAYMILDTDEMLRYDVREGDTEAFVNLPLGIDRVRMSIFLKRQDEGLFRVSIRSEEGVSANLCARLHFHGGGHELAAGGRLYVPDDVKDAADAAAYIEKVTTEFLAGRD